MIPSLFLVFISKEIAIDEKIIRAKTSISGFHKYGESSKIISESYLRAIATVA